MKKLLPALLILVTASVSAQTYTHPTVGLNSTYAGACMVNTCTGTYYDNGGAGGNYVNNINNVYRTFCPNAAGNCLSVGFTNFDLETSGTCAFDYLIIRDGPTQNSAVINTAPSLANGRTCGNQGYFTRTATNSSGCLTFEFRSDGSTTRPGWAATLNCVPCAGGPTGSGDNTCANATQVCSNTNINSTSPGPGLSSEGCGSCIEGGETYSNWFVFQMQSSGTLAFTITPGNPADDYDFALFGPNVTCGALGSPLRCSYSDISGATGLNGVALDNSEGVTGDDSWVRNVTANAGDVFYLWINHWTAGVSNYTLSWQLSGGASLDCTPLPVELLSFRCEPMENSVGLYWATASEHNNAYFLLERSADGINYETVTRVDGKGNSNEMTEYIADDPYAAFGTNYYRLTQVDYDGTSRTYEVISCDYGSQLPTINEVKVFDLNGKLVLMENENTNNLQQILMNLPLQTGMYILHLTYSNGNTVVKKFIRI